MAADLAAELAALKPQLKPIEVTEKTLPPILRERFIGKSGLYLVQIYPKGDIWEDAQRQGDEIPDASRNLRRSR